MMIKRWTFAVLILMLAGCTQEPPPTVFVPVTPAQTIIVLEPTITPIPPTPLPTVQPTNVPLFVSAFRHRTGVFGINTLEQWEMLDESNEQRILVRLLPPMGYGSRMTIDITNEGPLTPEQVTQLAESYVRLNYVEVPGYQEAARDTLADGRLQFVFMYNDGRGATGRETLTIQQVGPFFAAVRVFLSERDTGNVALALDEAAASFLVDPLAAWGTRVAAINPAELRVINSMLWQDRSDNTYYTGELLNSSPSDITDAKVTVSFCDENGIVIAEVTQPVDLRLIPQGEFRAFGVTVEDLPDDVMMCRETATAEPASPDPTYSTAVSLQAEVSYHQWRRDLTIEGPLNNYGLTPLNHIEVFIIAYNAENQVIGYAKVPLDASQRLDPGQSYDFEWVMPALAAMPHHVATQVQAQVINQNSPSLAPTITPLPTP